jgi:hypothetical protein
MVPEAATLLSVKAKDVVPAEAVPLERIPFSIQAPRNDPPSAAPEESKMTAETPEMPKGHPCSRQRRTPW